MKEDLPTFGIPTTITFVSFPTGLFHLAKHRCMAANISFTPLWYSARQFTGRTSVSPNAIKAFTVGFNLLGSARSILFSAKILGLL